MKIGEEKKQMKKIAPAGSRKASSHRRLVEQVIFAVLYEKGKRQRDLDRENFFNSSFAKVKN
jgi:hypothetical protein